MSEQQTSRLKWVTLMLALVVAVPLVAVLSTQAPQVLLALVVLGFLSWAGVRSGVLATADDDEDEGAVDPLVTLQERYAAGEITEAEFERRLDSILESDELAERAGGLDATAGEREPALERE